MLGIRTKWVSPIGLDIGHDSIKMLQLECQKSQLRVRDSAKIRFPESLRNQDESGYFRYHFLFDSIEYARKHGSFKGRDVILGLSKAFYDVGYLCLHSETSPAHPLFTHQAQTQLGLTDESSRIESFWSGRVREGNELLDQYVVFGMSDPSWQEERMMLGDLHFHSIDPDPIPCAFYRHILLSDRNDLCRNRTVVGVDIGGTSSTVIILNDKKLHWVRHIAIGGEDWTRSIMKKLHLSPDEALQLRMRSLPQASERRQEGASRPGRVQVDRVLQNIVRQHVEDLAHEIRLGLEYCGRRYPCQYPAEIRVFGGEASCAMVTSLLEKIVKIKVHIGRCFEGISLESGNIRDISQPPFSEWSTAIGLCLKQRSAQRLSVPA